MSLLKLSIKNVRNLKQVEINPSSGFNLIIGANASGKTSVLEAIYLLGFAKSFRATNPKKIINFDADEFSIYGQIEQNHDRVLPVAIRRDMNKLQIKLDNRMLKKRSELTLSLPMQIINPESHRILEQGPKFRRHYLDWGVFHVEHDFLSAWKEYCHILKQRNAALRRFVSNQQVMAWNVGLIEKAEQITYYRNGYLNELTPLFKRIGHDVFSLEGLSIDFLRGWSKEDELETVLALSLEKDKASGYTHNGPHRADIIIKVAGKPVLEYASRGQQKLVITALKLAQVELLKQKSGKDCPVLVDDLASELDLTNRAKFLQALDNLGTQVFITATDQSLVDMGGIHDKKMFHVKQGSVEERA